MIRGIDYMWSREEFTEIDLELPKHIQEMDARMNAMWLQQAAENGIPNPRWYVVPKIRAPRDEIIAELQDLGVTEFWVMISAVILGNDRGMMILKLAWSD